MKRFITTLTLICVLATPVLAQNRGALTNTFASWYTVTPATQVLTFPFKSRDISIHNTDADEGICVDLKGETTIRSSCSTDDGSAIFLGVNTSLNLTDYLTDTISFKTFKEETGTTASPVSVIVTY